MQELIKVTVQNDRQLVSARDLHEGLGLKRSLQIGGNKIVKILKKTWIIRLHLKVTSFKVAMER